MIMRILSLLFYTVFIVVSGNPISQLIVPSQQCAYQQTVYKNQPSSIPIIIQEPTNSILQYTQPIITQNQLVPLYQEEYEVFPVSDDISQVVFETYPNLQPILDPNYLIYGENGFESQILNAPDYRTPNIVNNYIIVPPSCCNCNDTQKIDSRNDLSNERIKSKKERKSHRKSKNKNPDNVPKDVETSASTTKKISNNGSIKLEENQGETRKRKRNKKPKKNITKENKEENEHTINQEINKDEDRRTRKHGNKIINKPNSHSLKDNNNQVDRSDQVKSSNQPKRRKKSKPKTNNDSVLIEPNQNQNTHYEKVTPYQINTDPMRSFQEMLGMRLPFNTINNQDKESRLKEKISDSHKTKEDKHISRNPKTSAVNDVNTFPSIPAEMQNIMAYMKNNFNGQQFGNSNIFANYPFNYDQLYQIPHENEKHRNIKRKKPRRPHNRKRKEDRNKITPNKTETKIETTTTIVETIKTTTETPINSHDSPIELNIESHAKLFEIPMTVPQKIYPRLEEEEHDEFNKGVNGDESNNENISYGHDDVSSDLDTKDEPDWENGLIYDYYPDFSDSAGFYANNNEYYVRHPTRHNYYDKNNFKFDMDMLNQERSRYGKYQNLKPNFGGNHEIMTQSHIDPIMNVYRVHEKSKEEVSTPQAIIESVESHKVDEIIFKTPPPLEFPDFKTEKVNKAYSKSETIEPYYSFNSNTEQEPYIDDFIEKSSIYSIAKTPMYNTGAKPHKLVQKPKITDIETVFVNSKVVKYGQPHQSEKETLTNVETKKRNNVTDNDKIVSTDHPIIVVAESLGYPEEIWYT